MTNINNKDLVLDEIKTKLAEFLKSKKKIDIVYNKLVQTNPNVHLHCGLTSLYYAYGFSLAFESYDLYVEYNRGPGKVSISRRYNMESFDI